MESREKLEKCFCSDIRVATVDGTRRKFLFGGRFSLGVLTRTARRRRRGGGGGARRILISLFNGIFLARCISSRRRLSGDDFRGGVARKRGGGTNNWGNSRNCSARYRFARSVASFIRLNVIGISSGTSNGPARGRNWIMPHKLNSPARTVYRAIPRPE